MSNLKIIKLTLNLILKAKSSSKEEDEPEPEPDDKETRSIADSSKDSDDDEDVEGKHGPHWLNFTTLWGQILFEVRLELKIFILLWFQTFFWEFYKGKKTSTIIFDNIFPEYVSNI